MNPLKLLTIFISILSTQACSPRPFKFLNERQMFPLIEYMKSSIDETDEKSIVDCVKQKLNSIDSQIDPKVNGTQLLYVASFLEQACETQQHYEYEFDKAINRTNSSLSIEFISTELAPLSSNFSILKNLESVDQQRNFTDKVEKYASVIGIKSCVEEFYNFMLLNDVEYLTSYLKIKEANGTEIELTKSEYVKVYPEVSSDMFECTVNDLKLKEMQKRENESRDDVKNVAEYIESRS